MSDIEMLAVKVLRTFEERGWMLATAESCTGGMIAAAITDLTGASNVLERGFVTYSNEAKVEMLGVSPETLAAHGAVSAETAREMAAGALAHSRADVVVSVTGVAGPGGGTAEKPVGLVWFGLAMKGQEPRTEKRQFASSERALVRRDSVATALGLLLDAAYAEGP
ncbi:CinA family protein [Chelativorans salis]|uniref:CinA family protein n=1 Tax=Chelativorans salis TaxID=2978478 RepID=A0ABT2LM56_9HYPH|nr:CinA family protein [Chelativorans sp. EGI FJ00035]MCT7375376.1 CinA family protein [Chelativorans sp. EGI FJ00035]